MRDQCIANKNEFHQLANKEITFQLQFPDIYTLSESQSRICSKDQNISNTMENNFVFEEDNNNVDENSNDQQYNDYANIHQQYDQLEYRSVDNESQNQRAAHELAFRESVYERLNAGNNVSDVVDATVREILPEESFQVTHRTRNNHRHSLSEDLSGNNVSQLSSRNINGAAAISPRQGIWLTGSRTVTRQSKEEIQTEAEELLCNFAMEEFQKQNVDTSHLELPNRPLLCHPNWQLVGVKLREVADAFANSPERQSVKSKAQHVDMSCISMSSFHQLCSELFEGRKGITQERIVVLFTFISDVAIQHVRIRAQQFINRLMTWSLQFIFDKICAWVQEAGGWEVVLCTGANLMLKVSLTLLASVTILALGVYIVKSVKDL